MTEWTVEDISTLIRDGTISLLHRIIALTVSEYDLAQLLFLFLTLFKIRGPHIAVRDLAVPPKLIIHICDKTPSGV